MILGSPQKIAEVLSLGLTIPTLILAASVVYFWAACAKNPKNANDWFILGVFAGFTGSFFDNLYWLVPWTASFLGMSIKTELVDVGVFFNIIFRQGLGIFAAYCHLKAAELNNRYKFLFVNKLLAYSSILGVIYCFVIIYMYMGI